jgi:hypothetical protein
MKNSERKKEFERLDNEMSVQSRHGDLSRARSITAGICPGGVTEINMRGNNSNLWIILQPVEVIEFIHQLAANVGCHIHLQPRNDFSSWRNWKYTPGELEHYRNGGGALRNTGSGHAPHVNDMDVHADKGRTLPPPEQQPGLQPALMARSNENEQTVATQKIVGRKRTKRAAAAA